MNIAYLAAHLIIKYFYKKRQTLAIICEISVSTQETGGIKSKLWCLLDYFGECMDSPALDYVDTD